MNINYIHQFDLSTDEYKGVQVDFDWPLIFISDTISPTNIHVLYSSVTWSHRRI
jgi:hypothetical protein